MKNTEIVELLQFFDDVLGRWFNGMAKDDDRDNLRKWINENTKAVRDAVSDAGCLNVMTLSPPRALGGPVHQNVDPFNMIFTDYFGSSVIPSLRDMVQRAIGVYQSGGPQVSDEQQPEETENITLQGEEPIPVPTKITLKWLIDHVPIKLWAMGVGLLVAAFLLGIKAASWEFAKEIIGAGNG